MPTTPRLALVVDDQPTNRLLASTLLKRRGWTVLEAESGEAALALSGEHAFRLVLLDISMPGLSGEETCTRLRATATGQAATIIAYTAHAFPRTAPACSTADSTTCWSSPSTGSNSKPWSPNCRTAARGLQVF